MTPEPGSHEELILDLKASLIAVEARIKELAHWQAEARRLWQELRTCNYCHAAGPYASCAHYRALLLFLERPR